MTTTISKSILGCLLLAAAACAASAPVPAPAAFNGPDFSGTYDCQGDDAREGKYTGTVTLALVPAQSTGKFAAYAFTLEVPGYGIYKGQAAASGMQMGVHFGLDDQTTKDYGTGIAAFSRLGKDKGGKWTFSKYYYEPEFKGGNHGTERCVQR